LNNGFVDRRESANESMICAMTSCFFVHYKISEAG
jgi:hypothetical protein